MSAPRPATPANDLPSCTLLTTHTASTSPPPPAPASCPHSSAACTKSPRADRRGTAGPDLQR
eukprot:3044494-Prymnesium_polylepis.1